MYEFLKPLQLHCLGSVTSITGIPMLLGDAKICAQPGDLICLRSTKPHKVCPFIGHRFSLALFSHQNVFYNRGVQTFS